MDHNYADPEIAVILVTLQSSYHYCWLFEKQATDLIVSLWYSAYGPFGS